MWFGPKAVMAHYRPFSFDFFFHIFPLSAPLSPIDFPLGPTFLYKFDGCSCVLNKISTFICLMSTFIFGVQRFVRHELFVAPDGGNGGMPKNVVTTSTFERYFGASQ